MSAIKKLLEQQKNAGSNLCIGIDPDINKLPNCIAKNIKGVVEFCQKIILATYKLTSTYKINTAFFEQHGFRGLEAMEEVFHSIPSDKFVIADAKRGDIGNTSKAYAKAFFEELKADAITVSPYMGSDSIEPFLEYNDKMIFILALTSNKGSVDFQRLEFDGKPLYLHVIEKSQKWKSLADIGFVAGATHSIDISEIRKYTDKTLLIPGIGAQGGDAKSVMKANQGYPAIINSSRAILYASKEDDYLEAAKSKAIETIEILNIAEN